MLPPHDKHCVDGSWDPTVLQEFTGTYAVVALDPVASVRFLDVEAAVAARELKTQKYLALIRPSYGWYDASHTPHYELDIYFVGRGPPSHPEFEMDESMSVPIYPAKYHSQSRQPLHPSQPLPWTDCYHHTLIDCTEGDAGRIYTSEGPLTTISQSAVSDLRRICSDDSDRVADIADAKGLDTISISEDTDGNSSIDDEGSVASPPHSADFLEDFLTIPQGFCPTFDVWLDLSILGDVTDPVQVWKELNCLQRLENECRKRQKAKFKEMKAQRKENNARTETWAEQIQSEGMNIQYSKREPADVIADQDSHVEPVQASPSSRQNPTLIEAETTAAPCSESLSASNSCFGGVIALASSWASKFRTINTRPYSRIIRVVTSKGKGFVRRRDRKPA